MSAPIRLYRPSNGTDGACFQEAWCTHCARDKVMNGTKSFDDCDDSDLCKIIADSFAYHVDEPGYPREWIYDEKDAPCCTAFVRVEQPEPPFIDTKTIDMFAKP